MPKITSFDVGIKNLAFCILSVGTTVKNHAGLGAEKSDTLVADTDRVDDIRDWGVLTIPEGKCVPETCENLIQVLDDNPQLSDCDYVVIENQPVTKNPKMKTIQVAILTYFLLRKRTDGIIQKVFLLNSSHKLKVYQGPTVEVTGKTPYTRRKKLAIAYARYFLKNSSTCLSVFEKHKKKDDLADSYLQALYIWKNLDKLL